MKEENAKLSRREREKIEKRQNILEASKRIFALKGFEKATLDEIAMEAEYGKGTIYNYFKNKEDLFISLMDYELNNIEKSFGNILNEDNECRKNFKNMSTVALKYAKKNADFFKLFIKEVGKLASQNNDNYYHELLMKNHLSTVKRVAEALEKGIKRSEIRNIDTELAGHLFIFLLRAMIWKNLCFREKRVLEKEVDFLVSVFFDGIAKKK